MLACSKIMYKGGLGYYQKRKGRKEENAQIIRKIERNIQR